jgi:hypothetical protein
MVAFLVQTIFASSEELGDLKSYGQSGRLYSAGQADYYLLSRQSGGTEDSAGYIGQIRIVEKYDGGAYEESIKNYTARCNAFDKRVYVAIVEQGKEFDLSDSIDIKNPERHPGKAKVAYYNLYWAACRTIFQKFK